MRLNDTQILFARTMISPAEAVERPDKHLINLFSTPEEMLPERLQIYRNNIFSSLTRALLDTYPIIVELTGEDFSRQLMWDFILENPPQEACLSRYGGELAPFIESFSTAKNLPYLADIARLEWAMNESYYAPDDRSLVFSDLQNVPMAALADITLPLRSSSCLLKSNWPLSAIHDFCLKEDRDESETLYIDQDDCRVMIYRPGLTVKIILLEDSEYLFLLSLKTGNPLGEALEITLDGFPNFNFQQCLQKHITLETFSAVPTNV